MKNSLPTHCGGDLKTSIRQIVSPRANTIFGGIIVAALLAFEIFNYSTTDYALKDLLGDLSFFDVRWATILAIAFCSIDFAGIARIFAPLPSKQEARETWYLFGAWFLAATMNAILTWWGISLAISEHALQSTTVVDPGMLTTVVPVFVALMVWMTRILVIGSLTIATGKALEVKLRPSTLPLGSRSRAYTPRPTPLPSVHQAVQSPRAAAASPSPARRFAPTPKASQSVINRPEPTYHSLTRSAQPSNRGGTTRRM